jgi:hypothetical protein
MLNVVTLTDALIELYDYVGAAEDAIPPADLAELWVNAFAAYMQMASRPIFPPGAIQAGKAAMQPILEAAFSVLYSTPTTPPSSGLVALTAGLTAFCVATTPLLSVVSIPPPAPLPPPPPTPAPSGVAAAAMATTIHTWVLTGSVVAPPPQAGPWQ